MPLQLCHAAEPAGRIPPPKWSQDVLDAFFEDARDHLVGGRPQQTKDVSSEQLAEQNLEDLSPSAESAFKLSELVEADTLTAEVKRLNFQITFNIRKMQSMIDSSNGELSRDFAMMSVLFAIISEYDQEMRWQSSAQLMLTQCYQVHKAFDERKADRLLQAEKALRLLGDLMSGQGLQDLEYQQKTNLVQRAQLMQSMELMIKERLSPTLASSREFRRRSQLVAEQAQLLAVLAEVIQLPAYEYTDDDDYLGEARKLREAARELSEAASEKNYEAARAAAGRVGQSCSSCHEGYRG